MTTTDPTPASMGESLSEADRLVRARAFAEGEIPDSPDAFRLGREIVRELLAEVKEISRELHAYKRAKAENDERFQLAAAKARDERDAATARVGVLEGQLATARASLIATAVGSHEHWEFIRSMEGKKDHYTPEATAFAEGSEKGSLSILQAFLEATGEAHPDDETTAAEEVVEAALDGSGMPRPPAVEAQERSETPGTGSGRGTGIAETQNSRQAREEWGVRRRDGRVLSFEDRDDAEAFADGWHGGERTVVHRFIGPWELAPSLPVPGEEA